MSQFKSREQELRKTIRYRDRIIVAMFLCLGVAIAGLVRAPHVIDVYQPPDVRYGHLSSINSVPPTTVYDFAKSIFTSLHQWEKDGAVDYEHNRLALRAYLTPNYHKDIKRDIFLRNENNELRRRTRVMTPAPGSAYTTAAVVVESNDAWIVYLDMRVTERVNLKPVKDIYVRYPIRVIRYPISRAANPAQLALDGYTGEPQRLAITTTEDQS